MMVLQNRHVQSLKWSFIRVSSIFMWHGRIATIIIWCDEVVRSQSCPTVFDPMDCSTPGLPVPHHLLEFAQVHLHWISVPNILSSVVPFFSCLQSFPASGSFPVSQLFTSSGQSIGASASVLLMTIQGWFPLRITVLISLLSMRLSSTTVWKHRVSYL